MFNVFNIKIVLVDFCLVKCIDKDLKIGEFLIEVVAVFFCKELGLYDYLIENYIFKLGLNFYWFKELQEIEILDNYYYVWVNC